MDPIRAGIIFDLDGTLVDTLDDITASLNQALSVIGRSPLPRDEVRRMVGEGLPALILKALGVDRASEAERLIAEYSRHHETHYHDHTRPYPGVAQMLDRLTEAGHPIAVLSNKPDHFTRKVVSDLLPRWRFTAALGPDESRPRKPDPAGALEIAGRMQRRPNQVFVVGDSVPDIETARRAGMKSVAVTWGYRGPQELKQAGPNYLVDSPDEVARVILES